MVETAQLNRRRNLRRAIPVAVATTVAGSLSIGLGAPANAVSASGNKADTAAGTVNIRGVLPNSSGMTLIAIGQDGKAVTDEVSSDGVFSLRVKKLAGVSLHLVAADGAYAGPVVLGAKNSTMVYRAFKKSSPEKQTVNLGVVKRKPGFAVASTGKSEAAGRLRLKLSRYVDTSLGATAQAVGGKPLGAGVFGFTEKTIPRSRLLASGSLPGADLDRDGVVNAFDVDNDGDRVLDNVDKSARRGSVVAGGASSKSIDSPPTDPPPSGPAGSSVRVFSNFKSTDPQLLDVVNVNTLAAVDETTALAAIDAAMATETSLAIATSAGTTITCSMVYCPTSAFAADPGGTGDFQWPIGAGVATVPAFPSLTHNDIASGDTFVSALGSTTAAGVLNMVFVTNPALKSWAPIAADSTVGTTVDVTYDSSGASSGTAGNRIVVPASGKVLLTFYVPQRLVIGTETGFGPGSKFVNQGGLDYYADMPNKPSGVSASGNGGNCGSGSLLTDAGVPSGEAVADAGADDTASGRTMSMIVDVDTCVGNFYSGAGADWTTADFDIKAQSAYGDNAAQKLYLQRGA